MKKEQQNTTTRRTKEAGVVIVVTLRVMPCHKTVRHEPADSRPEIPDAADLWLAEPELPVFPAPRRHSEPASFDLDLLYGGAASSTPLDDEIIGDSDTVPLQDIAPAPDAGASLAADTRDAAPVASNIASVDIEGSALAEHGGLFRPTLRWIED